MVSEIAMDLVTMLTAVLEFLPVPMKMEMVYALKRFVVEKVIQVIALDATKEVVIPLPVVPAQ